MQCKCVLVQSTLWPQGWLLLSSKRASPVSRPTVLVDELLAGLPEVDVITGLRILRRNHRTVAPHSILGILSSLPQVEDFLFEPWHQVDEEEEADIELGTPP